MQKSESIKNIGAALGQFRRLVEKIKKDSTNPFFKSAYCSLPHLLDSIQTALSGSGLEVTQFPSDKGLSTLLIHPESGEWIESEYQIMPVRNDPQSLGSAITYARRYALASALCLNIMEDDDGNASSQQEVNGKKSLAAESNTELPWLNEGTKDFDIAVEALASGKTTIANIKIKRRLSKVVETNLACKAKMLVNN